jgi:RND family efflux transporter MFP subunit
MSPPESSPASTSFEEEPSEESQLGQDSAAHSPPPKKRRWLIVLSLLIVGGIGLGAWLWWRAQGPESGASPPGQAQVVSVELQTTSTTQIEDSSEFVGSLDAPRSVELKPEMEGRVSEIFVREGESVSTGTSLVQLSPEKRQADLTSLQQAVNVARASRARVVSEIAALEAERQSVLADLELQNTNYNRISNLVQEGAFAQARLDEITRDRDRAQAQLNAINRNIEASRASLAEAQAQLQQAEANASRAQAELQDATIVAPFAGTVGDIPVKLGDYVEPGDLLTSVTQNQTLEVKLAIPIEKASQLRLGQTVEGRDNQGNLLATGSISFIAPQVDSTSQSLLAKAEFTNPDNTLRDGQFVRARIIWDTVSGVTVPTTAVNRLGGQTFVFVAEENEDSQLVARQKLVQLGEIQGNNYRVLEGISPGDRLITSGILNLSDGTPITPK